LTASPTLSALHHPTAASMLTHEHNKTCQHSRRTGLKQKIKLVCKTSVISIPCVFPTRTGLSRLFTFTDARVFRQ